MEEYYKTRSQLATEHALLDDNGDKLGTPAEWFRGVRATRRAKDGAPLDGIRAHQLHLILSDRERGIPAPVRRRRDEIERTIAALRDQKGKLARTRITSDSSRSCLNWADCIATLPPRFPASAQTDSLAFDGAPSSRFSVSSAPGQTIRNAMTREGGRVGLLGGRRAPGIRRAGLSRSWLFALAHGALGMDAATRVDGLLAHGADRPGGNRDMPVFLNHGDLPFQWLGARDEGLIPHPFPCRGTGSGSIATPAAAPPISASAIVAAIITEPAATAVLTRLGLVDRQPTAADLVIVQTLNGRLRLAFAAHLHEAEPFTAPGTAVAHHFRALDGPELREQLLEFGVADLVGQIPNKQPRTHSDAP